MDLANAPNGGVVDADEVEEMRIRRNKHGLLHERNGGCVSSTPIQQEKPEKALENGVGGPGDAEEHHHPADPDKGQNKNSKEVDQLVDIARDLNKIKRQNTVTHVLLGTLILMTAAWQVNEVSFLLWAQKKLSNPFKSLGDLIKGSLQLKGRKPPVIESSPLPPVGVPDVTRADLPTLVISGQHR